MESSTLINGTPLDCFVPNLTWFQLQADIYNTLSSYLLALKNYQVSQGVDVCQWIQCQVFCTASADIVEFIIEQSSECSYLYTEINCPVSPEDCGQGAN